MNDAVLLELARRWEEDSVEPEALDGSKEAELGNAIDQGERQAKQECADTLRSLVGMLGDSPRPDRKPHCDVVIDG